MESTFVRWRGHHVHVTDTGGQGDPLLLVPGLGNNVDMWTPFVEQFTTRRVIRLDAPGTGRSSIPLFPVSIPALAELLVAILDDRGIQHADVVGFSYGGAVAQQLAHDYPARVRRLVLAATFCGVGAVPGSMTAIASLATPLRYYSSAYFDRTAAMTSGGATGRDAAVRRRILEARRCDPPWPYGYGLQWLAILGWSSWPFLHRIPHETLVINGDDDPLVPIANAHILAERIPQARLEIVERAGHLFLWDEPERVSVHVDRFLNAARNAAPERVPELTAA